MGDEAACTVRFGRQVSSGKALLETDALIFRGAFRLAIPYTSMRRVVADCGQLRVTFPDGTAHFDLGPKAERWAKRIRNPRGLLDKLGVKPGSVVAVLNLQDRDFLVQLRERTARVSRSPRRTTDIVFLGVASQPDLRRLHVLARGLRPDGAIWVVAPRGSAVVRERDVLEAGRAAHLVDVKVVRFSETHTAHKFVVPRERRAAPQP